MKDELFVNEIFYSIDGEGERTGCPSIFIRLTGCNLRCSYCDTAYAFAEGEWMSVAEIMKEISQYNCTNITLTGGEPLSQTSGALNLLKRLKRAGYNTIVETNGAVDIKKAQRYAKICMDWKTPSSDMERHMLHSNLSQLRRADVLKIVMSKDDIDYVQKFLDKARLRCSIYLSPVFGKIDLPELAEFVKAQNGKARMQLQIHKFIWDINERGV